MARDNRYVRLGPRYLLRGWADMPYALVDSWAGRAMPLPKSVYETLLTCNGKFRPSDPIFLGVRREHLKQLEAEGVLEYSDEPSALEPNQAFHCYPNKFLREVHWSVTGGCNYRCRHCYMSAPFARFSQPSTEEALRLVDEMADCGVLAVRLTGGEALIRKDFLQIVEHIRKRGIRIDAIMSNGALVTDEFLTALKQLDVRCRIDVSFDGTDGWHDWLRGVDGAEEALVRAINLCRKHGFPVGAQYALHKGNASVLRKSVRMLGDLGVVSVRVSPLDAEGEGKNLVDYVMDYDEVLETYEKYLAEYLEDGMPVRGLSLGWFFSVQDGVVSIPYEHYAEERDCSRMPTCGTVRTCMYLTSDGYALPCIPFSYTDEHKGLYPDLHDKGLSEVLTDSSYLDFMTHTLGDVIESNPKCQACEYKNRCAGGCRAEAYVASGYTDPMAIDQEACRFFLDGCYDRVRAFVEGLGIEANLR